jgi:hypothetical protein
LVLRQDERLRVEQLRKTVIAKIPFISHHDVVR